MALHYVLDGYNVIHQLPSLADLNPEDSRTGLIRILQTLQPQGSFRNEVTVVFDGQTVNVPPQSPGIRVVFSYEETADEVIKRLVEDAQNVRSLVVITDDKHNEMSPRLQQAQLLVSFFFRSQIRSISCVIPYSWDCEIGLRSELPGPDVLPLTDAKNSLTLLMPALAARA